VHKKLAIFYKIGYNLAMFSHDLIFCTKEPTMKHWMIILFLIGIASLQATVIVGPFSPGTGNWNTVVNGGFESGLATWGNIIPSKGTFDVSNSLSFLGSYSAKCTPAYNFDGPGYGIAETIAVTPGQTYVLSGFFNQGNMTSGAVYLDFNDVYFEVPVYLPISTQIQTQWQFIYETVTIPTNVSSVCLRLVHDGAVRTGQYVYVDEIALTPINQFNPIMIVPEPSSVLLCLVIGLIALILKRRSN